MPADTFLKSVGRNCSRGHYCTALSLNHKNFASEINLLKIFICPAVKFTLLKDANQTSLV